MWEKVKKLFAPSDMTVGTPWKKIVAFMIPMLIGNIAQQMYNTVDSIVVGRYVGDNALAAVGSAGPIFQLLLVLFAGIAVGAGIMVSQYFGAKARDELSETIGCCITLTILASLALMILSPFIVRPLLELLDTPASIIDWCDSYLMILMIGIGGLAFYNILSGILRGMGDSVSAPVSSDCYGHEHCAGHLLRERSADGRQRRCVGHRNRADLFGDSLSDPSDEDARYL